MATRPKAVIESRNGEKLSPITITKNVLTDNGQNLHDILSDRKEDMMTPTIENSSSMFKVGQGDNIDYSENVVDGAYESCVLKGVTKFIDNNTGETLDSFVENRDLSLIDCKSPILSNVGKNLFTTNNMRTGNIAGNSSPIEGNDIGGNWQVTDYIPVKPLIEYYHSTSLYKFEKASFYDINKKIIYGTGVNNFKTMVISTPHQCAYVRYVIMKDSSTNNSLSLEELVSNNDIVVAQGSSNIAYEPYKSNILSCETYFDETTQSDKTIVLRSLPNGVYDTLNVETGEYTQRIGEVVLNGSEKWEVSGVVSKRYSLEAPINSIVNTTKILCICDKFPSITTNQSDYDKLLGITITNGTRIMVNTNYDTIDEFKQYLQQNLATVQYELATPIVSTIDAQGFPHAYTNGHVQLSSGSIEQSLTPKVEYSVVTNRNGQIRSNQKMVERHQKQLDRLQAMILTNLVNTQYEQTLTNLKYDLKNVREEVK